MNLVYVHIFKLWATDESRRDQAMDALITQFDQMLALPVPGQIGTSGAGSDFRADYLAAAEIDQGD